MRRYAALRSGTINGVSDDPGLTNQDGSAADPACRTSRPLALCEDERFLERPVAHDGVERSYLVLGHGVDEFNELRTQPLAVGATSNGHLGKNGTVATNF